MHFWIGERASQYHHHGRRQRPQPYGGTFFGSGFGTRRDKPFGQWNRRFSNQHPPQSTSSSLSSTSMVTPVHRFQTVSSYTPPSTSNTSEQNSARGTGAPGASGVDVSPRNRDASSYYNSARYHRSRSRERRENTGQNGQERRRRSSSSRRARHSNALGSTDIGVPTSSTNSEVRDSSFSSSEPGQPDCSKTKRIGLTLCFMGFILLCTVGAKFVIEGPGIIGRDKTETTAYFFLTELIFVAFAMALFFTGVACLRKRTNDYLLRQFNQHILRGTNQQRGASDDSSNSELLYDPIIITAAGDNPEQTSERNGLRASYPHPSHGLSAITTPIHHNCLCRHSPSHHSYHHHHHHLSSSYGPSMTSAHVSRHGHGTHYLSSGGSRRCPYLNSSAAASAAIMLQRQQPPPYHIALYLPLPSSATIPQDQCEIIDEQQLPVQVIGRESCSVSLKEEGVDASDNHADKKDTNGEPTDEEVEERPEPPETPPPSYEQFIVRL